VKRPSAKPGSEDKGRKTLKKNEEGLANAANAATL
jgi:hypothetical protein